MTSLGHRLARLSDLKHTMVSVPQTHTPYPPSGDTSHPIINTPNLWRSKRAAGHTRIMKHKRIGIALAPSMEQLPNPYHTIPSPLGTVTLVTGGYRSRQSMQHSALVGKKYLVSRGSHEDPSGLPTCDEQPSHLPHWENHTILCANALRLRLQVSVSNRTQNPFDISTSSTPPKPDREKLSQGKNTELY